LRIYIAANNGIDEKKIEKAKTDFIKKFVSVNHDDFVISNAEIIWFLTGGSEHNAMDQIEPQKKYCFLASGNDNSWAAATEVKALLNEKGVITRIFNIDNIESLEPLYKFIDNRVEFKKTKLAMIGKPESWLVASVPDYELLDEVLGINVHEYSWDDILKIDDSNFDEFDKTFANSKFETFSENRSLYNKMVSFIQSEEVSSVAISCFDFIEKHKYTACLPVALLNENNIPAVCEGDLCAAAGMIVLSRLTGKIPWMANLNYLDKSAVVFSHCTAPLNLLQNYNITTHFESGIGSAVRGEIKNQQVTVFRIDHKLEYCFLSLGEIIETGEMLKACRTQIRVKMSAKSLFLLREYPLGNHHLIIPGDYTDILAEYFSKKGFRIV
jgi:L-fucose isomerase-like protein